MNFRSMSYYELKVLRDQITKEIDMKIREDSGEPISEEMQGRGGMSNKKLQLLAEVEWDYDRGAITGEEKNRLQKVVWEYSLQRASEIIAQERRNRA